MFVKNIHENIWSPTLTDLWLRFLINIGWCDDLYPLIVVSRLAPNEYLEKVHFEESCYWFQHHIYFCLAHINPFVTDYTVLFSWRFGTVSYRPMRVVSKKTFQDFLVSTRKYWRNVCTLMVEVSKPWPTNCIENIPTFSRVQRTKFRSIFLYSFAELWGKW